jgi:Protein of unknown function (DUF3732)/AAA domain
MKCFVKFIGVLDKSGSTHFVEFSQGLNIITGKSSTGKSAIIEIFDYCFGSSDYTVPEGIITANAEIYFTVLQFPAMALVLARRGDSNSCFIKEINISEDIDSLKTVTADFFSKTYFMPLSDFKKELGRYFNVTLTDVDEDTAVRGYTGRKSSTPSVRSFTSFMLQHQNLVANKHAIFFRFDEKEKREQTIDHFKVFLGIADQEYFILAQGLNEKKQELKKIEIALPKKAEEKARAQDQISRALDEYSAISGTSLIESPVDSIVTNPQRALDAISNAPVQINALSTIFEQQRSGLEKNRSVVLAKLRGLERRRSAALASVTFAENFRDLVAAIEIPISAEVAVSACPFCESDTSHAEHEANRLSEAIDWLNNELRLSPYMRESFVEDEKKFTSEIEIVRQELRKIQETLATLDKQTDELKKQRSISELAMKAKLRVEATLELLIARSGNDLDFRKVQLEKEIKTLNEQLKKYNMGGRLAEVNASIESAMQEIGRKFDFEESYRPINLKFSLDTFDLWHEASNGKKVFLRAMGSGANWLYSHLTLFLALHRVFSFTSNTGCKIPPILFFDQPTQVYFPNYLNDDAAEFNANELASGTSRQGRVDEDLNAVVVMYNELICFCDETEKISGIRPQVIVTDHADHLRLGGSVSFDSFVKARWRSRGFIEL